MTNPETVGTTLKRLRKAQDLTQEDLAKKVREGGRGKCSHVTISAIERGKVSASINMISSLAVALGVDLVEFFGIEPAGEGRGWKPASSLSAPHIDGVNRDAVTQIGDIMQSAGFSHRAVAHVLDTVELWQKVEGID